MNTFNATFYGRTPNRGVDGVRVLIHEPDGAPAPAERATFTAMPMMTPGGAVLVGLMEQYLRGMVEPWVTLLEVHKLMYFAQVAGEPLQLKYVQAPYGPYAENLRHVLNAVEGLLLTGFADGGERPDKVLELVPGSVDEATRFLQGHPDSLARFARVGELVEGFETPFGMELLASVHWVVTHGAVGVDDTVQAVHGWNARKQQFTSDHIALAYRILGEKGWMSPVA